MWHKFLSTSKAYNNQKKQESCQLSVVEVDAMEISNNELLFVGDIATCFRRSSWLTLNDLTNLIVLTIIDSIGYQYDS